MKFYKKKTMVALVFIFSFIFFIISPVSFSLASQEPESSTSSSIFHPDKSEFLQGKLVFAHIVRFMQN